MANPNIKDHAHKGGRPKGSKDKLPRAIKDRVLAVWDKLEQEEKGLYDEAHKDPQWFYGNFIKPMLPKDVNLTGADGGPIEIKGIDVTFIQPGKD